MRLGFIGDGHFCPDAAARDVVLVAEAYGRTLGFDYHNPSPGGDPRPNVLVLHRFRHHNTGNNLVAGINLNYLSDEQLIELRQALPQILAAPNPRRFYVGQRLLPNIFSGAAWRYYNEAYVHGVVPGTLKIWVTDELKARYAERARKGWKTRRAKAKMAQARQEPEVRQEPPTDLPPEAEVDRDTMAQKQAAEREKTAEYNQDQVEPEIDINLEPTPEPERVTGADPEPPAMREPVEPQTEVRPPDTEVRPEEPGESERTRETEETRPEGPETPEEDETERPERGV